MARVKWRGGGNIEYGVRFSLPDGWAAAKILKAKFYIYSAEGAVVTVHVYDNTNEEIDSLQITLPSIAYPGNWYEVNLSSRNIIVYGDFNISITLTLSSSLRFDTSSPDSRTYSYWGLMTDCDAMIRAVVQQHIPVGGVIVPAPDYTAIIPSAVAVALPTAVAAAILVSRRRENT